jgi:hypothetical protein
MVVPFALVILFSTELGATYLGIAVLMATAQMLTYGTFFGKGRAS